MSFQISAFALRHVSAHLLMKSYLLPRQTRHQLRYDCQAFFWKAVPVSLHQSFSAIYPNCRTDVDSSNPVFLKINEKAALKYYLYFTFHKYSFLPHKQQKTMKNVLFFMVFLSCSLFVCNHGCPWQTRTVDTAVTSLHRFHIVVRTLSLP